MPYHNHRKCRDYSCSICHHNHNYLYLGDKQSLFYIWLILISMVILIFIIYNFSDRLLNICDFKSYITRDDRSLECILEGEGDIYSLNTLPSPTLLHLPTGYIPNIVDFIEDDTKV